MHKKLTFIAEIGLNHNGNFGLIFELIKQAAWSGADIAKFQLGWRANKDELNSFSHDDIKYQRMHMHLENYIHQKIQLEKIKNKYICKVSSPFIQETKFDYKITNSGIEETESI